MKKLLASKLQGVPQAEQDRMFEMIEKNPELFQKIAKETEEEIKRGTDQMTATMKIAKKYENELKALKN